MNRLNQLNSFEHLNRIGSSSSRYWTPLISLKRNSDLVDIATTNAIAATNGGWEGSLTLPNRGLFFSLSCVSGPIIRLLYLSCAVKKDQ